MSPEPNNISIKVSNLMLKKNQLIELTVVLSHSYVCCDMAISFLSIVGKL